jgi:hypothetical protein
MQIRALFFCTSQLLNREIREMRKNNGEGSPVFRVLRVLRGHSVGC